MYTALNFVNSNYLHNISDFFLNLKKRSYELMNFRKGAKLLDVGCGPGIDTISLADCKAQPDFVAGIDFDREMVTEAHCNARKLSLKTSLLYAQAVSQNLPFKSDSFDAVRSERMLQHHPSPQKAVNEMVRVCRKEGTVVIIDCDHSSLSINTNLTETEWKLRRFRTDYLPNGYAGRALYGQLHDAGVSNIAIELHPAYVFSFQQYRALTRMEKIELEALQNGVIDKRELEAYNIDLMRRESEGSFMAYMVMMVVYGEK
ncbi:hypothetical protein CHISP_0484 [Chitinispirillum alkaliphilum]|nr:hypothetical protein CHISP_0484 [Chitinispirillum alkaliphilum]